MSPRQKNQTEKKRRSLRNRLPLRLETLEDRIAPSGTPWDIQLPSPGPSAVTLRLSGGNIQEIDTLAQTVMDQRALNTVSNVIVTGAAGVNDTLAIDYGGGNFGIPFAFNGSSTSLNTLVIENGQFTTNHESITGATAGSVQADSESILFTGVASVTDSTTTANRVFDLTSLAAPASQQVRLMDDGSTTNGLFDLDSNGTGAFPSQTLANPTGLLAVQGSSNGTTYYLDPLDPSLNASVSITGGMGNDTLIVHDGVSASVAFDGGSGTNTVVNPEALGTNLTQHNVLTDVQRPLLFIPGFGNSGANFAATNGYQNWLLTRGANPWDLTLEPIAHNYYDFVKTVQNVGYQQGSTFFTVLWDWRVPVAVTKDGVNDGVLSDVTVSTLENGGFDSGLGYLEYNLKLATQSWQNLTGSSSTDVDFITHSTGGLIARAYLQSAAYATPNAPADIPKVHTLIQVGAPAEGVNSTFNFLEDNFSNGAAARVFANAIRSAYNLVEQQGLTITGPHGNNITKAWLDAQPNPQLAFISAYVSTLHDLLGTYTELQPYDSLVGGNHLLDDLNADGGLTSFVNQVKSTTIVYSDETPTSDSVTPETGFQASLELSNLLVPFPDLLGSLPASDQTWYTERTALGDGTVPYESSAQPYKDKGLPDVTTIDVTQSASGASKPVVHDQLVINPWSQKQILHALTGTDPVNIPDADISTNLVLNTAKAGANLVALGVIDPIDYINAGLDKIHHFTSVLQPVVEPYLDKQLPLINKSINDLLNDQKSGIGYDFFQELQTEVDKLPNAISIQDAEAKIDSALGLTPDQFNITLTGGVLDLNFDIDLTKSLTTSIDLSSSNLPVHGSIPLDLDLDLKTKFSVQIDLGEYIADTADPPGLNGVNLEVDSFELGAKLSSDDVNTTLTMDGFGSLTIAHGKASIGSILDVGLANGNTVSLGQLVTASPFSSLLSFTPHVPLSFDLPITAQATAGSLHLSGSSELIFSSDDLLSGKMPSVTLQVSEGLLSVSDFAYITGNFGFQIGQNATVQLSGGNPADTKAVSVLEAGATGVNIFVGTGGPYFQDSNGDGVIDSKDTPASAGARGFVVSDASFALALLTPTDTNDTSLYYSLEAAGNVQAVGMPAGVGFQLSNLNVEINGSENDPDHVVDFPASFPANAAAHTPVGLEVLTGGQPIYLADSDRLLQVDADATLTVLQQSLGGHFDFSDNAGQLTVAVSDLSLTLQAGSTTILALDKGNGSFQLTDTGISASISLALENSQPFPKVSISAENIALAIDTTNPQDEYVNVDLTKASLQVADVTFSVDSFTFTQNSNNVTVDAEGVRLTVGSSDDPTMVLTGSADFTFGSTQFSVTGSLGINQLNAGSFIQLTNPTLSLTSFSVNEATGALSGKIGVAADAVKLFPGKAFSATATGLDGSFDLGTSAFSLSLSTFDLSVTGAFEATAATVTIDYDPNSTDPAEQLVDIGSLTLTFPELGGLSGTVNNLIIRKNGFSLDSASVSDTETFSLGNILTATNLEATVTNLAVTYGSAVDFSGSIGVTAGSATLTLKNLLTASVTDGISHDGKGLTATFQFSDNAFSSLVFTGELTTITVGSFVTITARDTTIDTGASGETPYASFGQVSAQVGNSSLAFQASVSDLAILSDGSLQAGKNFGFDISFDSTTSSSLKWPSWLPINITKFDATWSDFNTDPLGFTIDLSADVTGLFNQSALTVTGSVTDAEINIGKLLNGDFPITGIGSVGVTVTGNLFGGTVDAGLVLGIANFDADGNLIPAGSSTTVAGSVLYGGLDGGFSLAGAAGFRIQVGLSELGPLGVLVSVTSDSGVVLDPVSGLGISGFTGAVNFFSSLPSISDPTDLRGDAFKVSPTTEKADTWQATLQQQVVTQYDALLKNPNESGFEAAFTQPMVIEGSATIFDEYLSTEVFTGTVNVAISTPDIDKGETGPKVFFGGTLEFAKKKVSIGADLYADLSNIGSGAGKIYFLSDIPQEFQLLTIEGILTFGFVDGKGNPVTATSSNPAPDFVIYLGSPRDANGDETPVVRLQAPGGLLSSDLMDISGNVQLTIDAVNGVIDLDMSGSLSLYYLGQIGSAAGHFVLDLGSSNTGSGDGGFFGSDTPKLYGALDIEANLDKLTQYGITATGTFILEVNTTTTAERVSLTLPGSNSPTAYDLAPETFEVSISGEFAFATSGAEWFRMDGAFLLKIDSTGMEAFATADLKIGPGSQPILDFTATGLLLMDADGLAAHINVDANLGGSSTPGFSLSGSDELDLNTTRIPKTFPIPDEFKNKLTPDELNRLAPKDGSTIVISAGPPQLGGGYGAAEPYLVISGSDTIHLGPTGSGFDLDGNLYLAVTPTALTLATSFTVEISSLLTFSGAGTFIIDLASGGLYGAAELTLGAHDFPGFDLQANFFIQVNTTPEPQTFQTYVVDTNDDATYGSVSVQSMSVDTGFEIAGGRQAAAGRREPRADHSRRPVQFQPGRAVRRPGRRRGGPRGPWAARASRGERVDAGEHQRHRGGAEYHGQRDHSGHRLPLRRHVRGGDQHDRQHLHQPRRPHNRSALRRAVRRRQPHPLQPEHRLARRGRQHHRQLLAGDRPHVHHGKHRREP